jgi:hypothetical protein
MIRQAIQITGFAMGFFLLNFGAPTLAKAEDVPVKYCGCNSYNDAYIVFNNGNAQTWGDYSSQQECLSALAQNSSCSTTIQLNEVPNIYCGCNNYNDAYIVFNNTAKVWGDYSSSSECLDAISKNLSCSPRFSTP